MGFWKQVDIAIMNGDDVETAIRGEVVARGGSADDAEAMVRLYRRHKKAGLKI